MNINQLIHTANFGTVQQQAEAQLQIWNLAIESGNVPSSIAPIYLARAKDKLSHNFTVPAFNLRGLTYQVAQEIFKTAQTQNVGLFIFEIARSEMGYTDQDPDNYVTNILAAAIKIGWNKPIFIQGDHFQVKLDDAKQIKTGEIESIKKLISQAIEAGFYNIDLDGSPLINQDDQSQNAKYVAELTNYIRSIEPEGVTVSIGGEIGEIGSQKNSTTQEVTNFMEQFNRNFNKDITGLSKLAVQTGTSHGGIVDTDGNIVKAEVAFANIKNMSQFCREKYGVGGVVQHGASTLSDSEFAKFPDSQAIEIHLATGLQNIIFDHPAFPSDLLDHIYAWIDEDLESERKEGQTDEQLHYKLRKKAWKPFKQNLFELDGEVTKPIMQTLADKFAFYFKSLRVENTTQLVEQYVKPVKVIKTIEDFQNQVIDRAENLAD